MAASIIRPIAVLGLVLMVVTACGDDDGEGITTTTSAVGTTSVSAASTTSAEAATPSLTLTVEGVVGSEGSAVVATLYTPERSVGSVCIPVDADPWTGSGVFTTSPKTGNPCDKNPPYGEVIAEEGDFLISLGLYTADSGSTPLACATATATIAGPSEVTISADDLGTDC